MYYSKVSLNQKIKETNLFGKEVTKLNNVGTFFVTDIPKSGEILSYKNKKYILKFLHYETEESNIGDYDSLELLCLIAVFEVEEVQSVEEVDFD